MSRTIAEFTTSNKEKSLLRALLRRQRLPQNLVFRARIILLSGSGCSAQEVAESECCCVPTVYHWRKRFRMDGVEGLEDRPRSGQPKKLSEKKVIEVLRMTVERIPKEATQGIFTSTQDLRDKIKRFIKVHNAHSAKPFIWKKTARSILQSVSRAKKNKKLTKPINRTGH